MIALITGGSGSGKSLYAEKLVEKLSGQNRVYLATMRVWDAESERRVARHRVQRADRGFATVECPLDLASVQLPEDATVLLEDVPNLVANEMFDAGGNTRRLLPALRELALRCKNLVLVTNDVFAGGAAYDDSTLAYMRLLAQVNAELAGIADYAAEIVVTIPVPFKGEKICV